MIANPPAGRERIEGVLGGFKAARIGIGPDGLRLGGAAFGAPYGPIDEAACVNVRDHVPPHPGCTCGFYAWKDRDNAVGLLNEVTVAVAEVELWGAFHEFELGYIAAVQHVRRVTLIPDCMPCLFTREPRKITAVALATTNSAAVTTGELRPVCDRHAASADTVIDIGQLAEAFGVEVSWAGEDDAEIVAVVELMVANLTPRPPLNLRRLDELLPGEVAWVYQNSIAQDGHGQLYVDVIARLVQPLPGTDVPIRLNDNGEHEVLLDQVTDFTGWRPRHDTHRFGMPLVVVGQPQPRTEDQDAEGA